MNLGLLLFPFVEFGYFFLTFAATSSGYLGADVCQMGCIILAIRILVPSLYTFTIVEWRR